MMRYISKKQGIFIFLYAILLLTYALFIVSRKVIPAIYAQFSEQVLDLIFYFYSLTCIPYYILPINLIIVYGLFRHRAWARYGVITVMLTIPIAILGKYLWWGWKSFDVQTIAIQIVVASLILFWITRKSVISVFGGDQKFKLKSKHGQFVKMIILFAFLPLIISFGSKLFFYWKYNTPFFISKPEVVSIEKIQSPELSTRFEKKELLKMSLLIPKSFNKIKFDKSEDNKNKLTATLSDEGFNEIVLHNYSTFSSLYDDLHETISLPKYLKSGFEFEKYSMTNTWNFKFLAFHSIIGYYNRWDTVKEIYIDDKKGFLKLANKPNQIWAEFSLYSSDDTRATFVGMELNKNKFNEDDIITIISSVEFL